MRPTSILMLTLGRVRDNIVLKRSFTMPLTFPFRAMQHAPPRASLEK